MVTVYVHTLFHNFGDFLLNVKNNTNEENLSEYVCPNLWQGLYMHNYSSIKVVALRTCIDTEGEKVLHEVPLSVHIHRIINVIDFLLMTINSLGTSPNFHPF